MKNLIYFSGFLLLISCSSNSITETIPETPIVNKWVNVEKPYPEGKDGLFPLVNVPIYKSVSEMTELKELDKVAIVSYNNKIKVYPYLYTNKSEIVNDSIGDYFYAVSYCPQTKSAINFNRIVQNDTIELVASGYLYKDNMVPSDKNYNMYWSQMLMKGVTVDADSKNIQTLNLIQTNWKTVVEYFPNAQVYFYEGDIITPRIALAENTLKNKTSSDIIDADDVFAIVDNFNNDVKDLSIIAYPIKNFSETTTLQELIIDSQNTIMLGNKSNYFFTTYFVPTGMVFHLEDASFPPVLGDNEGNKWNVFGHAISGPRKGQQLNSAKSYVASWWAWKDFFKENITIR